MSMGRRWGKDERVTEENRLLCVVKTFPSGNVPGEMKVDYIGEGRVAAIGITHA